MRESIRLFTSAAVLFSAISLSGCTGGGENEVLEYDPEESAKQSAEYEKQMQQGMKKSGRRVPGSPK